MEETVRHVLRRQASRWNGSDSTISRPTSRGAAIMAPFFGARHSRPRRDRAMVDWAYNAWGGKYPPYDLDDAIPQHVARLRQLPLFSPSIMLEGGSIEVNGRGARPDDHFLPAQSATAIRIWTSAD